MEQVAVDRLQRRLLANELEQFLPHLDDLRRRARCHVETPEELLARAVDRFLQAQQVGVARLGLVGRNGGLDLIRIRLQHFPEILEEHDPHVPVEQLVVAQ